MLWFGSPRPDARAQAARSDTLPARGIVRLSVGRHRGRPGVRCVRMGSRVADESAATEGARPDDGGQDDSGSEVDAWASSEDEEGLDSGAWEGALRDRPKTVHGKGKRGAVRGAECRAVEAACSRDQATHFFNRRAKVLCESVATFGEGKGQAVQCLLVLKKHGLVSPENRVPHRRAADEAA